MAHVAVYERFLSSDWPPRTPAAALFNVSFAKSRKAFLSVAYESLSQPPPERGEWEPLCVDGESNIQALRKPLPHYDYNSAPAPDLGAIPAPGGRMARTKLIMNPNADMGNAWRQALDLRPIVEEHSGGDWAGTVYPMHAKELAHQAGLDGYELVIAVGGDGTVHEVINGIMSLPAEKRPRFGVVPMGSGNDFAHAAGVEARPEAAMVQALTGKPHRIDIGLIEDEHGRKEYWDNSVNIGFGGSVNIYSHTLPLVRGFLMYFLAVLGVMIRRYDVLPMKIKSDGEHWQEELMMLAVCNGPREGRGFQTAPGAVIDDGLLNYTAVKKVSRPMMFRLIPEFMSGSQGKFEQVRMGKIKVIEIDCEVPLTLHTDGETWAGFSSNVHHLKISVLPGALELMRPDKKTIE